MSVSGYRARPRYLSAPTSTGNGDGSARRGHVKPVHVNRRANVPIRSEHSSFGNRRELPFGTLADVICLFVSVRRARCATV